jgi:hypothetical protein
MLEGKAYYETETATGRVEGFVGLDVESGKDDRGVIISAYAYDKGDDENPLSVSVHLSVDDARAYAQGIIEACDYEDSYEEE